MNAPNTLKSPMKAELELEDLTQEIDAPLVDLLYRDELTLSKLDFEDIEIALDF